MAAQYDKDDYISVMDIPATQGSRNTTIMDPFFPINSQNMIHEELEEMIRTSDWGRKEEEKQVKADQKVQLIKTKLKAKMLDEKLILEAKNATTNLFAACERERLLTRTWAHFRIDNFYISCESIGRPELAAVPFAIGDFKMLSYLNEAAKAKGLREGIPGEIAKRFFPELVIVGYDFTKYKEYAEKIREILKRYDPDMESLGLDEASLDLTNYVNEQDINNPPALIDLCFRIQKEIRSETALNAIFGIAPNKLLARLVSEENTLATQAAKYMLEPNIDYITEFMKAVPIKKLPGISTSCRETLAGLGIQYCGELLQKPVDIYLSFTSNTFEYLLRSALGLSRCYHELSADKKIITVSRSFKLLTKQNEMEEKIKDIAKAMAEDLRAYQKMAKQFTLTMKTHTAQTKQKIENIEGFTNDVDEIIVVGIKLLRSHFPLEPLKTMTLKAGNLINEDEYQSAMEKQTRTISMRNQKSKHKLPTDESSRSNRERAGDSKSNTTKFPEESKEARLDTLKVPGEDTSKGNASPSNPNSFAEPFPQVSVRSASNLSAAIGYEDKPREMPYMKSPQETTEPSMLEAKKSPMKEEITSQNPSQAGSLGDGPEIYCPICNMRFESAWNQTRINNHVDICLENGGNSNSASEISYTSRREVPSAGVFRRPNVVSGQNSNANPNVSNRSEAASSKQSETRSIPLGKKIDPKGEKQKGKRIKKNDDTKNNMKLDMFLMKKS